MQSLVSQLWGGGPATERTEATLSLGNALRNVLQRVQVTAAVPQLVMIGSQSAGKSSILNAIVQHELIPSGKQMTTRVPLRLELEPDPADSAEFGHYDDGGTWVSAARFALADTASIQAHIRASTTALAGDGMDVGFSEILLRLRGAHLPYLTLVDLPGLTQVACTDRGQPADIKQRILTLVTSYIQRAESIVVAVMPARHDLEADVCLELVKRHASTRALGVLTKLDLMERGSSVTPYLNGAASAALGLHYGYYAVAGFRHPPIVGVDPAARCGIERLTARLSSIITAEVRAAIPPIRHELRRRRDGLVIDGHSLDERTGRARRAMVAVVRDFQNDLDTGTGRELKRVFGDCRAALAALGRSVDLADPELDAITLRCTGNHMDVLGPSIAGFEACVAESTVLEQVQAPATACIDAVHTLLLAAYTRALGNRVAPFATLEAAMLRAVHDLFESWRRRASVLVQQLIDMEKAYVWCDERHLDGKDSMRTMLDDYYGLVVGHLCHTVPKAIMLKLVCPTEHTLMDTLFACLTPELLAEDDRTIATRAAATAERDAIDTALAACAQFEGRTLTTLE